MITECFEAYIVVESMMNMFEQRIKESESVYGCNNTLGIQIIGSYRRVRDERRRERRDPG
jgi:hypothetical protein